jgi:hypothetical protein
MSKIQVDQIVNKEDTGSPTLPKGVVVTGVTTSTTFDGAAASGSALETSINSKTSPGKAIALSMVFG